jgi:hypothetical protein
MSKVEEKTVHAIEAFLEGVSDLDALQGDLVQITWDNAEAPEVALEAELLIAETTSGDRTEESLREALAETVRKAYAAA